MTIKARRAVLLSIAMVIAMVASAAAEQTEVSLVNAAGSRTMSLSTLSGDSLTALPMGSAREAPFLVNVTDIAYSRQGYQVTAQLSNLYMWDPASSSWSCGDKISSNQVSVDFLTNPTAVRELAVVAQPVLDLSATLTDAITTALGLPSGTSIVAPVTEDMQSFANSTVYSGLESALPLKVATGAGGTFTDRMPHTGCGDGGASIPTAVEIQNGSISDDASMLAWVQSVADSVFATASGGDGMTAAEAVAAELVADSAIDASIRSALEAIVDNDLLITDLIIADVKALLTATDHTVASILGQTGSYTSLPALNVDVPGGTETGLFKGTMTITLIDPAT